MNEEKNKNNTMVYLVVAIVVIALAVMGYFIFAKKDGIDKPVIKPNEPQTNQLYSMEQKELVKFTHKGCNSELKELDDAAKTVKINYPVFKGTDETITNLNNTIAERVKGYVENFILDGVEIQKEEIENNAEFCNYLNVLDNNSIISYATYEHLDYSIIEVDNYLFAVEFFYLEMGSGRGGTDVFNVFTIDKTTGKVIENNDVIATISNIAEIKNLITSYVEKDENQEYDYIEKTEFNKMVNSLKTKLEKNEYKVYYEKNGNIVFVINDLGMWSTYRFMYDATAKTISVY